MNPQYNPNDPRFRDAVIDVVNDRVDAILTRVRSDLEQAGYADAAKHVRRASGE